MLLNTLKSLSYADLNEIIQKKNEQTLMQAYLKRNGSVLENKNTKEKEDKTQKLKNT